MYIKGMVDKCDHTGEEYPTMVEGVWALAQGATGRFCAVLWFGPHYAEQAGLEVWTREQCEAHAKSKGGWLDID